MSLIQKIRNLLNDGPGPESWALNYPTDYERLSIREQIELIPHMEREAKEFHAVQACPSCGWVSVHRFVHGFVHRFVHGVNQRSIVGRKLGSGGIARKCNRCNRIWKIHKGRQFNVQ